MSQISLKSISGITSITTPAGVDNQLTLHTNNTSQALKLDSAGNIHVHNHINTTGVTTASNFKTGTSNVHNVGIEIAGINVLGADTPIGAGSTIYNSGAAVFTGVVTATSFSGSGANLTSLPAQATIANNADNRVITGGSGVNLNGEANFTFDGTIATIQNSGAVSLNIGSTNAGGATITLDGDSNGDFSGNDYSTIRHSTDGHLILHTKNPAGASNVLIQMGTSSHYGAMFKEGAESLLRYNNNTKIETTNTGAKVTGNLSFNSAGQGIDFSASAHSSGQQSELLDDYERGSWTPSFWNAATGGTQLTNPSNTQATYVKVGRIVYLHLGVHGLQKNWAGSNTQVFVRGIPYRSYFQHNGHCVRAGYWGANDDDMNVYANLRQYDYYMEFQKGGGAQGRYEALYWSDMHWEGYGNLTCEMTYETDQGV